MDQLLVTESLTVVKKEVTIREDFRTGALTVLEHGAYFPSPQRQGEGMITEIGTLLLNRRQVPCQWKKVRSITAARVEKFLGVEIGLVDDNQHLYFPIFDRAFTAPNCPTGYWWTETEDARVRVVREVHKESDGKESFKELTEEEALPATSTNPQLDYAFYKVGKAVEAWMERCPNIKTWRDGIGTDVVMRAQQVILAGETSLYSLKCRRVIVQLATDWETHMFQRITSLAE